MVTVQISVDVPDEVNPDYIIQEGKRGLSLLVEQTIVEVRRESERNAVLSSDEEFAKFVSRHAGMALPPIVRASTYQTVWQSQELRAGFDFNDARRPVIMRGAKKFLQGKYDRRSAYGHKVFERFMRRVRFTCFDREQAGEFIKGVCGSISYEMHTYPEWAYEVGRVRGMDTLAAWVAGRHLWLTPHQFSYLKHIQSLVGKTEKLEQQISKLGMAA